MKWELLGHIAFQLWVLRRVRRATNAEVHKGYLRYALRNTSRARVLAGARLKAIRRADAAEFEREAERRLAPSEKAMERLVRYEAHAMRMLQKLLTEFRALQEARRDEEPGKTWIEVRKVQE